MVLASEIRQLPEADVKSLLLQIRDHPAWITKARSGELVIRSPIGLEPSSIKMNDIAWNTILSELGRHVTNFIFGFVGDAAHPKAEGPERWDRAAPGQRRVL